MSKVYDVYSPKVFAEHFGSPPLTSGDPVTSKSRQFANGVCEKLRTSLGSLCCESAVVTLTLVSFLAISGEILIDYGVLTAPSSSTPDSGATTAGAGGGETPAGGNSQDPTMGLVEKVFHYTSFAIAGIFFIEIVLKLAVFRMRFLVKPWQVMDMLVVVAALMVEIAFEVEGRMIEMEACTYIVVFRLWRLPHACNIKAKEVQRDMEQDVAVWKAGQNKMEDKCRGLEAKHAKQKEKIEKLEQDLTGLKRELKQSQRVSTHPSIKTHKAPTPNGILTHDTLGDTSSNHKPSTHHVITEETRQTDPPSYASEDSEDVTDSGKSRRRRGDGSESEQYSTNQKEDGGRSSAGNYFRSGSESSLSCQAQEHEVRVQIEGEEEEEEEGEEEEGEGDGGSSSVNTPVQRRRKVRRRDDNNAPGGPTVYYDNEGYDPDADSEDEPGVFMHEFDGSTTYKSAEGIPMTDL